MSRFSICLSITALTVLVNSSRLLGDGGTIVVLVWTNAVPEVQFDYIFTQLFTEAGDVVTRSIHVADVTKDYERKVRIAELTLTPSFDEGDYVVKSFMRITRQTEPHRSDVVAERSARVIIHEPPDVTLVTFNMTVSETDEGDTVALHNWYSSSRADNFSTIDWAGGPGKTESPDYAWFELMGYAYPAPAPGTMPLYHWYSPDRGDNLTTTDPNWNASAGNSRDGYGFVGIIAYVLSEPGPGRIPLYSWYSPSRGDNVLSANWAGAPGDTRSPDYRFVRREGYLLAGAATASFARGDSNASGVLDVSDAINILGFLFFGTPARLECEDAADADDSGELDISDGVYLLQHSFLGGARPPAPFGACGEDATRDDLGCESFQSCASADGR